MMRAAPIRYMRLEGCGNSFIIIHELGSSALTQVKNIGTVARALQHPNFGLGTDGLMLVTESAREDFGVIMRNPDGTQMGMCGNGIRCVMRSLFIEKLVTRDTKKVSFDVEGRVIRCHTEDEGHTVKVDMGRPSFEPGDIPINSSEQLINSPLEINGARHLITAVSIGNPHAVIFTKNVDDIPLSLLGPLVENASLFPKRTNVEFVEEISSGHFKVRVWERGAGATPACGTGACAVLMAAIKTDRTHSAAKMTLPGGDLFVEYDGEKVYLTGPAAHIASGCISDEFAAKHFPS